MKLRKETLSDWRIWYKLFFGSLVFIFIIKTYIEGMMGVSKGDSEFNQWTTIDKNGNAIQDYLGYSIYYIAFFTNQSNILVGFWFLFAVFLHIKEGQGKVLGKTFSMATTVYITVTGLVYNFMLLPTSPPKTVNTWINMMTLHTIIPLSMVIYFCFFYKSNYEYKFKSYLKKDFWKLTIYPIAYLILSLIRGEMIYRGHGNQTPLYAYPYFFLQVHGKAIGGQDLPLGISGVAWMVIAIFLILGIIFGFGLLYSFANWKIRSKKTNKITS